MIPALAEAARNTSSAAADWDNQSDVSELETDTVMETIR